MKIKYPKNQYALFNRENLYLVTRETPLAGMYTLYSIDENGNCKKVRTSNKSPLFKEAYPDGGDNQT